MFNCIVYGYLVVGGDKNVQQEVEFGIVLNFDLLCVCFFFDGGYF